MGRKLIFLDIDGTLCGRDHVIAPSTLDAIRRVRDAGHRVLIDTGRPRPLIGDEVLGDDRFDGVVSASGARAELGGETLFDLFLDPRVVTHVSRVFDDLGVHYVWQSSKGLWASAGYMDFMDDLRRTRFPHYGDGWWHVLDDARIEAGRRGVTLGEVVPASKCTFFVDGGAAVTLDDIRASVGDGLHIVSGSMGLNASVNGEGMAPGVDKGTGLLHVASVLGVPVEETVAIGDSENDAEMIETAGVGVAMGNATDGIKAIADWTTTGVDDDGVANVFRRLGLL